MRRWLVPVLVLLAFGCGRKEAPEAVVQILPAVVAEPEATQEPEPVRKPQPAIQPDAVPDTTAADTGTSAPNAVRIIKDDVFPRLHVPSGCPDLARPHRRHLPWKGKRTLTGYEVERAGGIQEAVKTVPGITGR